ncbi:DUF3592 domain-containing protein [Microbispora sp. H11081]|uniref:DUF3592 domain-containing protein n=1 Tax=Microbispora sp. H11081 TaxID=2729107 RepID=UPI001474E8C7|nr:DUF3592 domain-containing protein [Microbispora sp. H11081]
MLGHLLEHPLLALVPIGVVLTLTGVGGMISARNFQRRGQRTQGQVVRLRQGRRTRTSGIVLHYPIVRFTTAHGREVEAETPFGSYPPPALRGALVPLLYDPARPTRVRIDDAVGRGTVRGLIWLMVGIVVLAIGAGVAVTQVL